MKQGRDAFAHACPSHVSNFIPSRALAETLLQKKICRHVPRLKTDVLASDIELCLPICSGDSGGSAMAVRSGARARGLGHPGQCPAAPTTAKV